jgi:hypothetical protein
VHEPRKKNSCRSCGSGSVFHIATMSFLEIWIY